MGRTTSPFPSRGSASIPGTPGLSRNNQSNGRTQTSKAACIEIEDDEIDELEDGSVPCSSPYFTQPTQIVNRATQPTQIVNRTTLREPSSPPVPGTPTAVIEVPASSPFQPKSQTKPPAVKEKKLGVASRVGSLMAPAGTAFRPPTMQKASRVAKGSTGKKDYLEISDDELLEDYKKHDSSDDDTPARGDIRPSSFVKKENNLLSLSNSGAKYLENMDISLKDIRDVRLRHLTNQVYKIVQKAVPGITIRKCREALQKDVSWQVSKAVDLLTGRPTKTLLLSRPSEASDASLGADTNPTTDDNTKTSTTLTKGKIAPPPNSIHTFLKKNPSTSNSSNSSSQTSSQSSRTQTSSSSSNSIRSTVTKDSLPRRRLVQGRHKSTTPSAIFSTPSSPTSSLTSLTESREPSISIDSTMAPTDTTINLDPEPDDVPRRRRRLVRGRREASPPVITIPSDSDHDTPPPSKKRKLLSAKEGKEAKEVEPACKPVKSKKRKAEEQLEREVEPEPQHEPASESLTDQGSDNGYEDTNSPEPSEQEANVLKYLNTCTVEALGHMLGSGPNAKIMVSARPFKNITAAQKVSRVEKGKSKNKNKSRTVAIGEDIVEKLTSWMEACEAATAVINECDRRGADINLSMSKWSTDKNGLSRTDSEDLEELPIKSKPELMSESLKLKSYQLVGLNWMNLLHSKGYSGILADDMGLGKTCQVISFIAHLVGSEREEGAGVPWPNLIVVPPSTYENWIAEFEKFAPEINIITYSGKSRRDIHPRDARDFHVILTTYPQIERQPEDLAFLRKVKLHAAIFDEGHRLKNSDNNIYKQMMQVPSEWRLVLSGTPVQNNLKELLTVLRILEPSIFEEASFETLSKIFNTKVTNQDVLNFAALASERVDRARSVMAPFILQRRKEDVLDLPKKTDRLEIVGMHDIQKKIYDSIKGKYFLSNGVKSKGSHPWMQLRKAAIHHQLFRDHFTDSKVEKMVDILWKKCSEEELGVQSKQPRHRARLLEELMGKSDFQLHLWCKDFEQYIGHLDIPDRSWEDSPKVQRLLEMVRGYMKTGDRVLVFSRFEMVIDILRETLHHAGIKYCCLTGAMDTAARFPECQEFTNNTDIPVFLLTTGAGGTGLNLTAANKIIIFDQSDNPQEDVQASNRAHRIGQTRDVEVIRLITEKTVERLIYNSCIKKLVLAARVAEEFAVEDENQESVEEQCKKLMLLGEEEEEVDLAEVAPASQQV
ncbi:SNF2 family N-terminal domain-containing protein [Annulohypoxylon maeteangense]|uniref:SNF2 family N-terminal domain-containing protein n=1 Tax=Annulohypoxylon maeteangense TaxID=1927788 RepID=UPI0020083696|nr:SNF2 family N-terminal domain-containing protein [Annulohypoxylon maeteangense]KAI0890731.1 SNF2 family N-terminal domain-containing protein [Annulohypoxylon maeteangense]